MRCCFVLNPKNSTPCTIFRHGRVTLRAMTTPTELEAAQAMLDAYLEAEKQILAGKEVRLGGPGVDRWLRLEDLDLVRDGRKEWDAKVRALKNQAQAAANPELAALSTFGGTRYGLSNFSANR